MVPLYGLVLAGGKSSRMGRDKAWIDYHGKPQVLWLAELMKAVCTKVAISSNAPFPENQKVPFERIPDDPSLGDIGPIAGLISAFRRYPNMAWMVVGCDYPNISTEFLLRLSVNRSPDFISTAYRHPDSKLIEPVIAVYEPACLPLLESAWRERHFSLRHFLETGPAKVMDADDPYFLKSADTPYDVSQLKTGSSSKKV